MDRIIPALCQSIENGEWEHVYNPYCLEQNLFKHVSKGVTLETTPNGIIEIDGIDVGFHNYTRIEEALRKHRKQQQEVARIEKQKQELERISQLMLLFPPLEEQQ